MARLGRPDRVERTAALVRGLQRALPLGSNALRWWSVAVLAMCGVLLLSCAALADRHFHSGVMTGEEAPIVFHPTGRPVATNLDLNVLGANPIEVVASTLQSYGFRFVRLTILWSEIEPVAGATDWQRTDEVVEALTQRDVQILAVLRGTPEWARTPQQVSAPDAPPADPATFAVFARAFAERYGDRVRYVQVWDLPNLPERWGREPATPESYVELLAAAQVEIKAVQPDVSIVLSEFEPRPGSGGLGDLDFLRAVYASGAESFFEVVAATVDGGERSPFDRTVDPDRTNLSRLALVRDVMQAAGDTSTPVWGTRYGWRSDPPPSVVTPELQAEFAVAGIERAREEWPWLGMLFAWSFITFPDDPAQPYALLTTEGGATAQFTAIAEYATGPVSAAAGIGYIPTGARSLTYSGRWQEQELPLRTYQTTTEVGARVTIVFDGTGIIAYLRRGPDAGAIDASIDGRQISEWSGSSLASFQARDVPLPLVSGLDDQRHELVLTLTEPGDLTVGGFVVTQELPFLWPIAMLAVGGAFSISLAVWQATRLVAVRAGLLRHGRGDDVWVNVPELTRVPSLRRT